MVKNLAPLVEKLRIDLAIIAKDMRIIGVRLRKTDMSLMAYRLFTNADLLDKYVERLK